MATFSTFDAMSRWLHFWDSVGFILHIINYLLYSDISILFLSGCSIAIRCQSLHLINYAKFMLIYADHSTKISQLKSSYCCTRTWNSLHVSWFQLVKYSSPADLDSWTLSSLVNTPRILIASGPNSIITFTNNQVPVVPRYLLLLSGIPPMIADSNL